MNGIVKNPKCGVIGSAARPTDDRTVGVVLTEKNIVNISTGNISEEHEGIIRGRNQTRGETDATVWLLPSIMAIWFANGSKRRAEPFLPTISLHFVAEEHSSSLMQLATLKCLESTFAYACAN